MLTLYADPTVIPTGLLPVPDVAKVLGVNEAQVVDWCKRGVIESIRYRGIHFVAVSVLEHFIRRCRWVLVEIPGGEPVSDRFGISDAGRATLTSVLEDSQAQ